jgi:hypothetical protein
MIWTLLVSIARAQDPSASVEADGTVVVSAVVCATPEAVRAVIDDPVALGKLSPDVLATRPEAGAPEGCQRLSRETRGLFRPLRMLLVRCRTESGWREQLVSSDDFSTFGSEWTLTPTAEGTQVVYRVKTEVNYPVPKSTVTAAVKEATLNTLRNLVKKVTGG